MYGNGTVTARSVSSSNAALDVYPGSASFAIDFYQIINFVCNAELLMSLFYILLNLYYNCKKVNL